jgi:hypothetical protein
MLLAMSQPTSNMTKRAMNICACGDPVLCLTIIRHQVVYKTPNGFGV